MTADDRDAFRNVFRRLYVGMRSGRRVERDAVREEVEVYFTALDDLSLEYVTAAADRLLRKGSGFWPSTQEWHAVADRLAVDAAVAGGDGSFQLEPEREATEETKVARTRAIAQMREKAVHAETSSRRHTLNRIADTIERLPVRATPTYGCVTCYDTGFVQVAGGRLRHCDCLHTNPVLVRRRQARASR